MSKGLILILAAGYYKVVNYVYIYIIYLRLLIVSSYRLIQDQRIKKKHRAAFQIRMYIINIKTVCLLVHVCDYMNVWKHFEKCYSERDFNDERSQDEKLCGSGHL